jgi:hypothetical protein
MPGRYDPDYEERGQSYPLSHIRWTERENMRAFLELLADNRVDVGPLVSHRFSIEDGERAYKTLSTERTLAILLEYPNSLGVPATSIRLKPDSTAIRLKTDSTDGTADATWSPASAGPVRVNVIGAGNFARGVLLPCLARNASVELRTVFAAIGVSARAAADRFGFSRCSSSSGDGCTDPDGDAVVIATRHDSHADLVIAAIDAGKPAFVEKPLCITTDELDRIVDAAARSGGRGRDPFVMVGFNRRFAPAVQRVRARMQGRTIGIVYRVNAGRIAPSSWIVQPGEGGGRVVGEADESSARCATSSTCAPSWPVLRFRR